MTLRGIPSDEEFTKNLAVSVGLVVVNFGLFEFSLNCAISVISHGLGYPKGASRGLPHGLERRLDFMKDAAKQFPALTDFRADILRYMGIAKKLSKTRHGVVHGYPADYAPESHTLTFLRLAPDQSQGNAVHQEGRLAITIQQLLADGKMAETLAANMARMGNQLLEALPQNAKA